MNTVLESKESDEPKVLQQELVADVEEVIKRESDLTLLQAVKLYPKAVAWSAVISAATIMEGYDFHVLGSLFAQPAFQRKFGTRQPNGTYQVSAAWQSGLNNGASVGALMGLFLAGYLTDKLGFRKTIMLSLFFTLCFIFIQFFSTSLVMYLFGQIFISKCLIQHPSMPSPLMYACFARHTSRGISDHDIRLCGGGRTNLSTGFSDELRQSDVGKSIHNPRPSILARNMTNTSQVIGQILSTCVIRGVLHLEAPWAYRIPFAVQ